MATCTIPIPITDKVLTDHSVAEPSPGEVVWDAETTFGLDDKVILGAPSEEVTITVASPAVVSWTANGLPNGTPVILTTTGDLPTGLEAGEIYYIVNRSTDAFQLSATLGGAPVVTTGTQSGVHTATASIHTVYVSQVASNTGNPPAIDDGGKWFALGPTNLYAMIDLYRPSITWGTSPMTFELTPQQVAQSITLGTLDAEEVRIVVTVDGVTKYDETIELYTRKTFTPLEFCFKPWTRRREIQKLDLPLYPNSVITVTLTKSTGMVGIGEAIIGQPEYLGRTQYGAKSKVRNYTTIDRRIDGTVIPPEIRRNVPTGDWTIMFDKEMTGNLVDLRDRINGKICVFSALDDDSHDYFPALLLIGFAGGMDLDLSFPNNGVMTLSVEEN